ncbi:MAG: hypothetical protein KatS3mg061_2911 [Dehalococcoidia bacterium]|nr:MAG: hypothetical protein KatS3mg061_2911 [Dehalococcoidia bacterium]
MQPVILADLVPAPSVPPSAPRPREESDFGTALARATNNPAAGEPAPAPADLPVEHPEDPGAAEAALEANALAFLLAALSQPAAAALTMASPPALTGAPPAAPGPPLPVPSLAVLPERGPTPFAQPGQSSPSGPTVGDLAALLATLAGEDIAAPATLTLGQSPLAGHSPTRTAALVVELTGAPPRNDPAAGHQPADPLSALPPLSPPPPTSAANPAAAPPTPSLAEGEQPVAAQLAAQILPRLQRGGEFHVTLQPPHLGTVDVAVQVGTGGVHVRLAVEDAARDLVQAGLAELRQALRPADGRELVLEVAPRFSGGFDSRQPFSQSPPAWSARRPRQRGGAIEETPLPRLALPTPPGRVDYRV